MTMKSATKASRFLSLILRHHPETINVTLDKNGWCDVQDLLEGLSKSKHKLDMFDLKYIVDNDGKGRYKFNSDMTKIRANQGHSITVDVELKEEIPPAVLYHGTSTKFVDSIKKTGLIPKGRLYVHLSQDRETAYNVGSRHGKPVVLRIDTERMFKNGMKFYISDNNVWLIKNVPAEYIDFSIRM